MLFQVPNLKNSRSPHVIHGKSKGAAPQCHKVPQEIRPQKIHYLSPNVAY